MEKTGEHQRSKLIRLKDSNLSLADPEEDIRGRKVTDKMNEEIGTVDDLFVDEHQRKVRFLQVVSGGFLGIGGTTLLVPVDAILRITPETVHINEIRERVHGAPRYDPNLVDDRYIDTLYGHYGYLPFWGSDYIYPPYPRYPH